MSERPLEKPTLLRERPREFLPRGEGQVSKLDPDEVVQMLADGKTVKVISQALRCHVNTVSNLVKSLRKKTGLKTSCQLVAHYVRNGWVD